MSKKIPQPPKKQRKGRAPSKRIEDVREEEKQRKAAKKAAPEPTEPTEKQPADDQPLEQDSHEQGPVNVEQQYEQIIKEAELDSGSIPDYKPLSDKVVDLPQAKLPQQGATAPGAGPFIPGGEAPAAATGTAAIKQVLSDNISQMSPDERRQGAETVADLILDGYGMLKKGINYLTKIDEDKLHEKHLRGEIDLNYQVPVNAQESASVQEIVQSYNGEVNQFINFPPETRNKWREPLIRVSLKRGWVVSDEVALCLMAGKDLTETSIMAYNMKRQLNKILRFAEEQTKEAKNQAQTQPHSQPQQQTTVTVEKPQSPEEAIKDPAEQVS